MDKDTLFLIFQLSVLALSIIIGLLILWAIIRGAVLSALRKHAYEQQTTTGTHRRI